MSDERGEDRFEDLGGPERRAAIGERLEERDRTHPEPDAPEPSRRPEVPRAHNKYAWAVAILMLMVLGVLLLVNTLPNSGEALFSLQRGERLPDFAVPLATGQVSGDANLCAREPCPEQAGPVPACEIHSPDVFNVCELNRKPLVLTFIFDRGADCFPQVDRTERVRGSLPGVQFATVYFTRKDRGEVRRLVRARGWTQPVGVDRDGEVANRYAVGVCPTTVFANAGGRVLVSKLGNLTESELKRVAGRLRG